MISVSYLTNREGNLKTIKKIDESNADFIHVDLMDGVYVPEKNFVIDNVLEELKVTNKKLDIHLMTKNPLEYIEKLINLNVWMITIHLNSTLNIKETIDFIKKNHIKVGIAINPYEDIYLLTKYIDLIDYVLIMSVIPGKGGQKFIPEVLKKIEFLKDKNVLIGIDGGINSESIKYLKGLPINNIVSGSFVCMSDNFNEKIDYLRENLK